MKKFLLLLALALILSLAPNIKFQAQAQPPAPDGDYVIYLPQISKPIPPTWLGPDGGKIIGMAVDPLQPEIVYAGTWGAGIYKSTNGGALWSPINNGLENKLIYSLAVHPRQSNILFAGTYRGKLYKSVNGGASWFLSSTGIQAEAIVYDIAIDPVNPDRMYIATRGISNNGNPPWNGVVYRSTDGGTSWRAVLTDVPSLYQQDWAYSLAINPASPKDVYAAMHEHGVLHSDDYGISWYSANQGLVDYSTRDIVIDSHHTPYYAYAGFWHGSGIFKSTDNASTWFPANNALTGAKIFRITLDQNQADTLYLSTQSGQGVMKSTTAGNSWYQAGLINQIIWDIIIHPQNSQVIYSGTDADGVYKSTNAGSSWFHAQKGITNISTTGVVTLPGSANTLYVSTMGKGVLQSTDSGLTWNEYNLNLDDLLIHALVQNPANPNQVFALSDTRGLFSTDISLENGWTAKNEGLPLTNAPVPTNEQNHPLFQIPRVDNDVSDLLPKSEPILPTLSYFPLLSLSFAPNSPNVIYLGTAGGGVYKSINGAVNWAAAGLAGRKIWSLAVHSTNPNLVYAADDVAGGVKFSLDGGSTWQDLPIGSLDVYAVIFSTLDPTSLFAGTSQGLYQWSAGSGWTYRGLANRKITALAARPTTSRVIYVGTDSGAFLYDESTSTWLNGPSELSGNVIQAINFDLNNLIKGYFSTNAQGVLLAQIR